MGSDIWTDLTPAVKEEPVALWLMSFSDLIALLLAFFVLLFSMRELDLNRWNELRGGVDEAFSMLPAVVPTTEQKPQGKGLVYREGSVLPYLMQVWQQKMTKDAVWSTAAPVYVPEPNEIWVKWPEGAGPEAVASVLAQWRNRVRLVAGNVDDADHALAYLNLLKHGGVSVLHEVRFTPGVAAGVWLVVEDKQ